MPVKLLGIPLYLDLTFLLILPVLAWLIGSQLGPFIALTNLPIDAKPLLEGWLPYLLGLVAALALFASVVVHELGHAVTARVYGVETERITLWLLGGMAHFKDMPRQRGAEAVVAVAGPITSLALGGLCWILLNFVPVEMGGLYFVVVYTMYMNIVLAVFNMIPALPLDGGRVLRSLLHLKMSRLRATEISARISRVLAIILGLFGLLSFNVFLIILAFFIYIAVTAEAKHALFTETLSRFTVESLMSHPVATISPTTTVEAAMERMFKEGRLAYPVRQGTGDIVGTIHINMIRDLPKESLVATVMGPAPGKIQAGQCADILFDEMIGEGKNRILVVSPTGEILGIITKTDLVRAIQIMAR